MRPLPLSITRRVRRRVRVTHAGRTLTVPVRDDSSLRDWTRWTPGWKSQLIADHLRARPGTFVDVGANTGQTLLDFLASGSDGAYVGFEPITSCAAFLQEVITGNGLDRCCVVPVALSDGPGLVELLLHEDDTADSSATTVTGLRPGRELVRRWVPAASFDTTFAAMGHTEVSLVKIDVEGSEDLVLAGMAETIRRHQPTIVCEVLRPDAGADQEAYAARVARLWEMIATAGYEAQQLVKAGTTTSLRTIEAFPLDPWTPERAEDCDYLLTPRS